jgi:hypothetical protein
VLSCRSGWGSDDAVCRSHTKDGKCPASGRQPHITTALSPNQLQPLCEIPRPWLESALSRINPARGVLATLSSDHETDKRHNFLLVQVPKRALCGP